MCCVSLAFLNVVAGAADLVSMVFRTFALFVWGYVQVRCDAISFRYACMLQGGWCVSLTGRRVDV